MRKTAKNLENANEYVKVAWSSKMAHDVLKRHVKIGPRASGFGLGRGNQLKEAGPALSEGVLSRTEPLIQD